MGYTTAEMDVKIHNQIKKTIEKYHNTGNKKAMTKEERELLKRLPTKMLLKKFKMNRTPSTEWKVSEDGSHIEMGETKEWLNLDVPFRFGKFSQYNPHKGSPYCVWYSVLELKAELDTREHIERKRHGQTESKRFGRRKKK